MSHVPLPALQVMYRLMRLINLGLSGIVQSGILADRADQTFDPSATLERFPIELARLEDFIGRRAADP